MREKGIYYLYLLLWLVLLPGCADLSGENMPTQETEPVLTTPTPTPLATSTSTVEVTPTILLQGSDPFPFSLDEVKVSCQYLDPDPMQDDDHWADALIPGVSTIDDLLALTSIPDDIQPKRVGLWSYQSDTDNASFDFEHGILYAKGDPRTKLGEIIQHYGHPQRIVWEIPLERYDGVSYATYLIYPEHRALFFAWDKVTWFTTNTVFGYSNFYAQDGFDVKLSALTYPDYNRYEELVWPCGE